MLLDTDNSFFKVSLYSDPSLLFLTSSGFLKDSLSVLDVMASSASSLWFHVASATQRDKQYRWIKERGKERTEKKALYVSVRADKSLEIQLVLSLPGGRRRASWE